MTWSEVMVTVRGVGKVMPQEEKEGYDYYAKNSGSGIKFTDFPKVFQVDRIPPRGCRVQRQGGSRVTSV